MKTHILHQIIQERKEELARFETDLQKLRGLMVQEPWDEVEVLTNFETLFGKYPANPVLLNLFTSFLQLLDQQSLVETYELKDIEQLFDHATTQFPDDMDLMVEYIHFLDVVMGDDKKAKDLTTALKERMESHQKAIQELVDFE